MMQVHTYCTDGTFLLHFPLINIFSTVFLLIYCRTNASLNIENGIKMHFDEKRGIYIQGNIEFKYIFNGTNLTTKAIVEIMC